MLLSSRASDEVEIVRTLYPCALIVEDKEGNGIHIKLTLVHGAGFTDKLPELKVNLHLPSAYLPDNEEIENAVPLEIRTLTFFASYNDKKLPISDFSKETIKNLELLQNKLHRAATEVINDLEREVVFEVLTLLQEGVDNVDDKALFETEQKKDDVKISEEVSKPKPNAHIDRIETLSISRVLIKWHHMLPGRQHAKETAVWNALESKNIIFSVVCLGKPSLCIVEGDTNEIRRFICECGRHGKKAQIIQDEIINDKCNHNNAKQRRPKYLNPIGNKKNEKTDLSGFKTELLRRYGETWVVEALREFTSK